MNLSDNYVCEGQMSIFDVFSQDTLCGKTSPAHYRQELRREKTSESYLKKFAELRIKPPQYLCLKKENGRIADVSWETGGALLGVYMMHSFGESPKDAVESRLSQILEVNPHPKYSLSAKACKGILTRAERRGKELPEQLYRALMKQSLSKNEQESRGGVKESLSSMNEQEHCQLCETNSYVQPIAGTLDASYYKGCGERSGVEREIVACLEGNGSRESHRGDGYKETDTMYTLNTVEQHAVCVGNGQLAQAKLSDKVGTLNCMHDQQAVMVFEPGSASRVGGHVYEDEVSGTVRANAGDNQQAVMVMGVDSYNQTAHFEQSETLRTNGGGDNSPKVCVTGVDSWNLSETGEVGRTLTTPSGGLNEHVPCVVTGVDLYNQTTTGEKAKSLNSAATDSDHIPCVAIDRASFNQGKNAQYDFSVQEELAQTLVSKGPGGGNDTVGALCARDYKGVGSQYVSEGKCIVQSVGKPSKR